ncbi:MAG TPA: hypothetical protein VGO61_12810 [Steroidobacteraceae bacterium]|jgi:hypothetical protein|nr:hypothetical protein [Steroidobacteraceae bacterium]
MQNLARRSERTSFGSLRPVIASGLTWLIWFFALVVLCGCSSLGTKPPRGTNLTGNWQLNESLSQDPLAQMREQRHDRGDGMRRGGGMRGGGMRGGMRRGGMPGGQGGGWSGRGDTSRQRGPGALGDFVARPQELAIEQTARELDLKADGAATEFVYGEKVMASVQNGTAERVSGWKGDEFVVKYKVIDGATATRNYQLADSGRQMIVTTQIEGGRARKLEYRTVYVRKAKDG